MQLRLKHVSVPNPLLCIVALSGGGGGGHHRFYQVCTVDPSTPTSLAWERSPIVMILRHCSVSGPEACSLPRITPDVGWWLRRSLSLWMGGGGGGGHTLYTQSAQ